MVALTEEFLIVVLLLYHTVKAEEDPQKESQEMCDQIAQEPYFEPEMVIGKPWRVYYMWHMNLENRCMDMVFRLATPKIIRRVYYDMSEYLATQPAWGAASLLLSMGRAQREMLLFNDQGPAGRFLGVPNTARDGTINLDKNGVPLMKFQMKLLQQGKILFIGDCMKGLASLCARHEDNSTRKDILDAARTLFPIYGTDGFPGCKADIEKNEELLML